MVESQLGYIINAEPVGLRRIITAMDLGNIQKREVGDRYHPSPGIPINLGKCVELFDIRGNQACFLKKLASRALLRRLVHLEITSRERPHPFEGRDSPLHQQDLQVLAVVTEYHTVRRHRRPRIRICELAFLFFHMSLYNFQLGQPDSQRLNAPGYSHSRVDNFFLFDSTTIIYREFNETFLTLSSIQSFPTSQQFLSQPFERSTHHSSSHQNH